MELRIDKYLWAIRVFKTRSLATDACKAGKIKLNGNNIKPSHTVKIGELYHISKGIERKTIKVIGLTDRRTDAPTAITFYEDLTPIENTYAFKKTFHHPLLQRDIGDGRPTKKDRRDIDDLQQSWFGNNE